MGKKKDYATTLSKSEKPAGVVKKIDPKMTPQQLDSVEGWFYFILHFNFF